MRGSPPLHLVLFAVGFALLAVPLAQLTFARPAISASEAATHAVEKTPTVIRLQFAHVPAKVSLKHEGVELLSTSNIQGGASRIETRAPLELSSDGIELMMEVTWPDGTPNTAVSVELEPDEKDAQSQTRWSRGAKLGEALTYQWKS